MKYFDFNVHFSSQVNNLCSLSLAKGRNGFEVFAKESPPGLCGANFMIFNSSWLFEKEFPDFLQEIRKGFEYCFFTVLFDFRSHPGELLERAEELGIKGIKFHALQQKIFREEYPALLFWAAEAARRDFIFLVDASYGTPALYRHRGLEIAALLIEHFPETPLIILHSGGARVLEALLIAVSGPQVYLETSFTLPFYRGSSVEGDLAFAYRKLGTHRVLYASDHPFVPACESLKIFLEFCEKYDFSDEEKEKMLYRNAFEILIKKGKM